MPTFFRGAFLKSEYIISNGGYMDNLDIDENNGTVTF